MKKKVLVSLLFASVVTTVNAQQSWMSQDVGQAWSQGYKGQGATITHIDGFADKSKNFTGYLGGSAYTGTHGEQTVLQSSLIAPGATVRGVEWTSGAVPVNPGLNIINASFSTTGGLSGAASSAVTHARSGGAIVTKSAGNKSVAVAAANDSLNNSLRGAKTAIYVGALDRNGSNGNLANLASYSNYAGTDPVVQKQFLTVGVDSDKHGVAGTSFAAPVVAGYAAIIGSKFTGASPIAITNQLLNTARTDTINGYTPSVHGRGEASLSRALAPVSIR